ncbi:MAG: porin family protein [Gammaproteobacteria bacterium]|nr:porin family protein [Gammaproteobacteria bacterium]MCH9717166.1 porin family protein [Gammaproteobacteria bacterium]MCH9763719.1 porin family protein [Gammaproteobacteria bacterium]
MTLSIQKITAALLLLSTGAGYCGTPGPLATEGFNPKNGLYLGAGVGTSINDYNLYALNYSTGINNTTKKSSADIIGNVFIGYGYTSLNDFYLGLEAGTNFPGRATNIYNRPGVTVAGTNIYSDTLTAQDYITLDLVPGFRPNTNWLIYGRAGLAAGNLQFYQAKNITANTEEVNDRGTELGGRLGVGLTYAFNQYLSLSADYFYTEYKKFTNTVPKYTIAFQNKGKYNFIGGSLTYTT